VTAEARAAFVSFTEVLDGRQDDFERWHALDHMPEQFGIDGIVAAQRWSADPGAGLSAIGADPTLAAAHHVHVYLVAEPVLPAFEEMATLAAELIACDRWFDGRRGLFNAPFEVAGRWASPSALVRPRVLPYRPNTGVLAALVDGPHAPPDEAADDTLAPLAAALLGVDGVAGAWTFEAMAADGLPAGLPCAPAGTRLLLAWLDGAPEASATALRQTLDTAVDAALSLRFAALYRTRPARAGI
jgi:hypothetical protein